MSLEDKMKRARSDTLAQSFFDQGVKAANRGLRAKCCPHSNPFAHSNWVRGFYSVKE